MLNETQSPRELHAKATAVRGLGGVGRIHRVNWNNEYPTRNIVRRTPLENVEYRILNKEY